MPNWSDDEGRCHFGPNANGKLCYEGDPCPAHRATVPRRKEKAAPEPARSLSAEDVPALLAEVESRFTEEEVREVLRLIEWDGYLLPEARANAQGLGNGYKFNTILATIRAKRGGR